jgi:hypothetical protein
LRFCGVIKITVPPADWPAHANMLRENREIRALSGMNHACFDRISLHGVSMRQSTCKTESATTKCFTLLIVAWLFPNFVYAHDYWFNGKKVPSWVKSACCGPTDAHRLAMSNIHTAPWNDDYMIIDGYKNPYEKQLRCQVKMDLCGSSTKIR